MIVDWGTRVIRIFRADTFMSETSPGFYSMDVNAFRLALKAVEDDEGMPYPDTHRHNTQTILAGVTYARSVEIINNYTVEWEDAQYTVTTTGANHNLSDVKVANQVSLVTNNSAGLIQTDGGASEQAIELRAGAIHIPL